MSDEIESILTSTKKLCSIAASYTDFDSDIILHINSVFSTLAQMGIGPVEGFMIEDATAKWVDFLGTNKQYNAVKSYMYLRVRLIFDPPATHYAITAWEAQIKEAEWRLSVLRESTQWVDPKLFPPQYENILDGGTP